MCRPIREQWNELADTIAKATARNIIHYAPPDPSSLPQLVADSTYQWLWLVASQGKQYPQVIGSMLKVTIPEIDAGFNDDELPNMPTRNMYSTPQVDIDIKIATANVLSLFE